MDLFTSFIVGILSETLQISSYTSKTHDFSVSNISQVLQTNEVKQRQI